MLKSLNFKFITTHYTIYIDDMDYFTITNVDNVITIILKSDVTEDVIPDKVSFQFSIKASRSGAEGFAAVVILIEPDVCLALPDVLRFEKSLYTGQLSVLNELQIESLKLTEVYTETVQFVLEGCKLVIFILFPTHTQKSLISYTLSIFLILIYNKQ